MSHVQITYSCCSKSILLITNRHLQVSYLSRTHIPTVLLMKKHTLHPPPRVCFLKLSEFCLDLWISSLGFSTKSGEYCLSLHMWIQYLSLGLGMLYLSRRCRYSSVCLYRRLSRDLDWVTGFSRGHWRRSGSNSCRCGSVGSRLYGKLYDIVPTGCTINNVAFIPSGTLASTPLNHAKVTKLIMAAAPDIVSHSNSPFRSVLYVMS
jgi:hypothetical protein